MRCPRSFALFACGALSLAACGASGRGDGTVPLAASAEQPGSSTPSTAPATTPATTLAAAPPTTRLPAVGPLDPAPVLATYDAYMKAYLRLMQEPDPAGPALTDLMTGTQRARVGTLVQDRLDENHRLRFPAGSVARRTRTVESMTTDRAVVVACAVDDSYRLDLTTGAISNDAVQTVLTRVALEREANTWKVENILVDRTWDGVAGCAA